MVHNNVLEAIGHTPIIKLNRMKEKGSAQAVYYGHDHMNDYGVMYEGILLSYIQSAGYSSYNMGNSRNAPESEWVQGYTKLEIKADGTYDAYQCFNHK